MSSAKGLTLVELLVVIMAMTVLSAVLWAPVHQNSNLRSAALTVARIHDLLTVAYQFRMAEGKWPVTSANECASIGFDASDSVEYASYSIATDFDASSGTDNPVTGWGGAINFDCSQQSEFYTLTYSVPEKWKGMIEGRLEKTSVISDSGGLTLMRTTIDKWGNQKNRPQFFLSDRISSGYVSLDKPDVCDESAKLLFAPTALCQIVGLGGETLGFEVLNTDSGSSWGFKFSRLVYGQTYDSQSGTYVDTWGKQNVRHSCNSQSPRIQALIQCSSQ